MKPPESPKLKPKRNTKLGANQKAKWEELTIKPSLK